MAASQPNAGNISGRLIPRAWRRREVAIDALVKGRAGEHWNGTITDLCEQGCKVRIVDPSALKVGGVFDVRFSGLEAQAACLAWSADGYAGMKFLNRLAPHVVDDLARHFRPDRIRSRARSFPDHPGEPLW